MDVFEWSAVRRLERQLAPFMTKGERILEFDAGITPNRRRVRCIATDQALYVVVSGGPSARLAYADMVKAEKRSFWLAVELTSGDELLIDFRGSPRGHLTDVVVDRTQVRTTTAVATDAVAVIGS